MMSVPSIKVIVDKDTTLLVEGPSKVRIVEGSGEVFGAYLGEGVEVEVDLLKAIPFYAVEKSVLEVYGGKVWAYSGSTIPNSWREVAEKIVREGFTRIMVVGGVDVGKTGFITFLANKLLEEGKVGVVDADTGQSIIGPPTTIGLGVVEKPIPLLSHVQLYDALFIGLTSPAGLFHRSVTATKLMADLAENIGCKKIIVDTTGWVSGEGRDLKIFKTLVLQPDLVVFIDRGELKALSKILGNFTEIIHVEPAITLRARSRDERRSIRSDLYSRFFKNATEKEIPVEYFDSILYAYTFTGERVDPKEVSEKLGKQVYYAELLDDRLLAVIDGIPGEDKIEIMGVNKVQYIPVNYYNHILVAFQGEGKMFKGLGIIQDIDFQKPSIKVYTNVDVRKGDTLQWGYIRVNPETFEEEGWIKPWSY